MSSENLEDFKHFHFPATNCFSNKGWRGALIYAWNALVRHISRVSLIILIERSKQIVPRLVIYHQKAGNVIFLEMLNSFHWNVEWISTKEWNWYLPATNTWNESIEIPEIWLDFTILQGIANKLFRNESYMTRKVNILAFQNRFSHFHWNVERESRRLSTFLFSCDQLFFEQEMRWGA